MTTDIDGLKTLRDFLWTLDRDNFSMMLWGGYIHRDDEGEELVEQVADGPLPMECDTIGCILGWATRCHPDLRFVDNVVRNLRTGTHHEGAFADAYGLTIHETVHLTNACGRDHWGPEDAADLLDDFISLKGEVR